MRAAVIDIGSNSIKLLVADRAPDGSPRQVLSRTLEVRISEGIGSREPRLGAEGMARGIAAVAELASDASHLGSGRLVAVATSAVRDASNGQEFREGVRAACGVEIRILTGLEEANLIGRGLTTDPALKGMEDFDVFDLGGGSLECLAFRGRAIERPASLPLGCVRLTEIFVDDPSAPFGDPERQAVAAHVREALQRSVFPFPVAPGTGVIGTGGTLTTVRAIAGAKGGLPLEKTDPTVEVSHLRHLLALVAPLDLAGRKKIAGLPPERADVFPTALATLLALADLGDIRAFHHSLRNLRWGLAAEILG